MADRLDEIVLEKGKVYGISDKGELIRRVLADFIYNYDQDPTKNLMRSSREVKIGELRNDSGLAQHTKQDTIDIATKYFDAILKHMKEKDCKHNIKEILSEWQLEKGTR